MSGSLYDEDGIDGPFERGMSKPIKEPERRRRCAVCGGFADDGTHVRCTTSGYEGL